MRTLIVLEFFFVVILMLACTSKVKNDVLTEANYLHEDSVLWMDFEKKNEMLTMMWDSLPSKRDSIQEVYDSMLEDANRMNIELAFKYASTPSGLQRLFMCRNYISKDDLRKTLLSLSEEMQSSDAGLNIKAHLETEQLVEGDILFQFPCKTSEGVAFDWNALKGKQVLLLYSGLGCMGEGGRNALKRLYERTSRENLEIIVYWPSSSLENLQSVKEQSLDTYIFISDFKQESSPMKIKYGCQATPICLLTDRNHKIVVKSEGLNMDEFKEYL